MPLDLPCPNVESTGMTLDEFRSASMEIDLESTLDVPLVNNVPQELMDDEEIEWITYDDEDDEHNEVTIEGESLPLWRSEDCGFSAEVLEILEQAYPEFLEHRTLMRSDTLQHWKDGSKPSKHELEFLGSVSSLVSISASVLMAVSSVICRPFSMVRHWWLSQPSVKSSQSYGEKRQNRKRIRQLAKVDVHSTSGSECLRRMLSLLRSEINFAPSSSSALFERDQTAELVAFRDHVERHAADPKPNLDDVQAMCKHMRASLRREIKDLEQQTEQVFLGKLDINNVKLHPQYGNFQEIDRSIFHDSVREPDPEAMFGCDCRGKICRPESCSCMQESRMRYDEHQTLLNMHMGGVLTECGSRCRCSSLCHNRVVQLRTIGDFRLDIFYVGGIRQWGVRSGEDIPAGKFICQYVGEIVSEEEAGRRDDSEYLWTDTLSEGGYSESSYTIDADRFGNISRFLNHSCAPNVLAVRTQTRYRDARVAQIAFFTNRFVNALEELTLDYNYGINHTVRCQCGAKNCRGWLR